MGALQELEMAECTQVTDGGLPDSVASLTVASVTASTAPEVSRGVHAPLTRLPSNILVAALEELDASGCLHVHPDWLPDWQPRASHKWAIESAPETVPEHILPSRA